MTASLRKLAGWRAAADREFLGDLVRALPRGDPAAQQAEHAAQGARSRDHRHRRRFPRRCPEIRGRRRLELPAADRRGGRPRRRSRPSAWASAFPFTVFADSQDRIVALKVGELHEDEADSRSIARTSTGVMTRPRLGRCAELAGSRADPPGVAQSPRQVRSSIGRIAAVCEFRAVAADCGKFAAFTQGDVFPTAMARLLLLNGPNLNLLGQREPGIYGADTLEPIDERASRWRPKLGHELVAFQSNAEHELHRCASTTRQGEASRSSSSIRAASPTPASRCATALLGVKLPFIEVHLSQRARARDIPSSLLFLGHRRRLIVGPRRAGLRTRAARRRRACSPNKVKDRSTNWIFARSRN